MAVVSRIGLFALCCLAVALGMPAYARAEAVPTQAEGKSCLAEKDRMGADGLAAFAKDPLSALTADGKSLLAVAERVRTIAATDPATAATLVTLAKGSDRLLRSAVGAGLARAAVACKDVPELAFMLQKAVADAQDELMLAAFTAALNQPVPSAIGSGAQGGTGGDPTGINGNGDGNPPTDFPDELSQTVFQNSGELNLTIGGAGGTTIINRNSASRSQ